MPGTLERNKILIGGFVGMSSNLLDKTAKHLGNVCLVGIGPTGKSSRASNNCSPHSPRRMPHRRQGIVDEHLHFIWKFNLVRHGSNVPAIKVDRAKITRANFHKCSAKLAWPLKVHVPINI